ncbi:hypothetical protein KIW84_052867 [Lathyrus oleraceus]|uniref:Helicase C-terminal domain-containing protein n=1 Tax=Pisum sativum TaxID=3888 RepID=A0A9D4WPT6_PEA|nr:hypothetical protein KIW84_052867 [Pisum sativum]
MILYLTVIRDEVCYSPVIYPVNREALWTKYDAIDLHPPPIKRQPGRPKKKRNREAGEMVRDETHLKREKHRIKCSRCHKEGHNKATCKLSQPVVPPTQKSKGLILVTSDVSARGVDYPDVTLVVQVGLPADRE